LGLGPFSLDCSFIGIIIFRKRKITENKRKYQSKPPSYPKRFNSPLYQRRKIGFSKTCSTYYGSAARRINLTLKKQSESWKESTHSTNKREVRVLSRFHFYPHPSRVIRLFRRLLIGFFQKTYNEIVLMWLSILEKQKYSLSLNRI
jgi:hypothetical protein